MKVYTQTGDRGKTSLLSGERILKSHLRIRAYGEVDELGAVIGVLAAALTSRQESVLAVLQTIQSDLFQMGAWLSATPGSEAQKQLTPISESHWRALEGYIDMLSAGLPELKSFILPGGLPASAWAHMARTVCRRAERGVIELAVAQSDAGQGEADLVDVRIYLNRLSDYFFVLARYLNHEAGVADVVWRPPSS